MVLLAADLFPATQDNSLNQDGTQMKVNLKVNSQLTTAAIGRVVTVFRTQFLTLVSLLLPSYWENNIIHSGCSFPLSQVMPYFGDLL